MPHTFARPQISRPVRSLLRAIVRPTFRRVRRELRRLAESRPERTQAVARPLMAVSRFAPLRAVQMLTALDRDAEAVAVFRRAVDRMGSTAKGQRHLGRMAQTLGLDEARAHFAKAVELEPENWTGWFFLAQFETRHGDLRRAVEAQKRAVAMRPEWQAGRAELSFLREVLAAVDSREADSSRSVHLEEALIEALVARAEGKPGAARPCRPGSVVMVIANLGPGGAQRQLVTLARGLKRSGRPVQSVSVLCHSLKRRNAFFAPELEAEGVSLEAYYDANREPPYQHRVLRPYADLLTRMRPLPARSIAALALAFHERRPQVVHAWQDTESLYCGAAAAIAGVERTLLHVRNCVPVKLFSDKPKTRRKAANWRREYRALLSRDAVRLLANSESGARYYETWLGLPSGAVGVLRNALESARFRRDAKLAAHCRTSIGIPEDAPVVGGVFRLEPHKRPLLWLRAAAIVAKSRPDAYFVLVGDGPLRDELTSQATALGLASRLHLAGQRSAMSPWYGAMTICLLTSSREGQPNVLIESQWHGVPVVACDVGGVREVMEQGTTGWAVDSDDAEALAERVLWSLSDEAWCSAAERRGPSFVDERFSLKATVRDTLAAYALGSPPVLGLHADAV